MAALIARDNIARVRHQKKGIHLFKVVCIIIAIPFISVPSFAGKSDHGKDQHTAQELQSGPSRSRAEIQEAIDRLNQLSFKTRNISLKEGYTVTAGTFHSQAEVEEAIDRLRQLSFETSIISLEEGYTVTAGTFHSRAEVQEAIDRLHQLSFETRIISLGPVDNADLLDVGAKRSQTVALANTEELVLAKANTHHAKEVPTRGEAFIPRKAYEKLEREVEVLKAQMQSLLKQKPPSETHIEEASPDVPPPAEDPPVGKDSGGFEGSREKEAEESRRELDQFLRNRKVLFKPGELALEFNVAYAQNTADNLLGLNSAGGLTFTPKSTARFVDTGLLVRYGLANNLELDLSIPYGYNEQEFDIGSPLEPAVARVDNSGLGDINGLIAYTALHESGIIPTTTVSLNAKSTTGDENKRLGTGFWNVGGAVSLVKTIDPVVFFGSLGYTATLKDGGVDPGDQISYSFGAGFSMNDRVSFSTSLTGTSVGRAEIDGQEILGSALELQTLQFSSTIQLKKRLFLEPFIGFGLTEEASDISLGLNVPFRFDRRFPLPFFHN